MILQTSFINAQIAVILIKFLVYLCMTFAYN